MAIISTENKLASVILIFQVDPKMQTTLLDAAKENSQEVMEKKPGFISVNLHKSFDGTSVVNYAQWETRKSYEEAISSSSNLTFSSRSTSSELFSLMMFDSN